MKKISLLLTAVLLLSLGLAVQPVLADEPWADLAGEEFTFVVGFAAGGSNDLGARILADRLNEMGIDVSVVNRPGSVGVEAAGWVADQSPDSNIFYWGVPMTLFFEPAKRDVGFTWEDFEPVATLGGATFALATSSEAEWDTLEEIIDWALENPGQLVVGGQGELSSMHFTMALIFDESGVDYIYVPFAGGADVQMNLAGGHVDIGHLSVAASYPLYTADELKLPVHTSVFVDRVDMIPDVPNVAEAGFPDARELHVLFLWAPQGTPQGVTGPLSAAIGEALTDPKTIERLEDLGILVSYLDAEETRQQAVEAHENVIPAFVDWYHSY